MRATIIRPGTQKESTIRSSTMGFVVPLSLLGYLTASCPFWRACRNVAAIYCLDSQFAGDPAKFVAGSLQALSAMVQLELPHVNVLTKLDLCKNKARSGGAVGWGGKDEEQLTREASAQAPTLVLLMHSQSIGLTCAPPPPTHTHTHTHTGNCRRMRWNASSCSRTCGSCRWGWMRQQGHGWRASTLLSHSCWTTSA